MFDFAWTELALIGVVALIAIGPKDMPVAIKTVAEMIKKARRMAGEFQTHVDEMVREANLDEVRNQINEIRNFDIKGEIEKAVDADGTIRDTFANNPLEPTSDRSRPPPARRPPCRPRRVLASCPSERARRRRGAGLHPARDRAPAGAAGLHPAWLYPFVTVARHR